MANGKQLEIRLAGSGGQGLILAGIIMAEAAILYDAKNAVQTQSYGPEARGGASKSEVIISEDAIDYPKCEQVDILLSLNQKSLDKYLGDLKKNGVLIVDKDMCEVPTKGEYILFRIPFAVLAQEEIGKSFVANIIALGAIAGLTDCVTRAAIERAVMGRVPPGTEEINRKALAVGFREAAVCRVDTPIDTFEIA
ncbi:MAG: 2-oxoacid:acceptor oxidoreductase family protein [Candidatus Lernaella stagnicola]|nr:2-oxoacid:acceptor oxidoreductase family protein [Candidatus Lernaella stagnicola]